MVPHCTFHRGVDLFILNQFSIALYLKTLFLLPGEAKFVCDDYKGMQDMNDHVTDKLRQTRENMNSIGNEIQMLNDQSGQVEAYLKAPCSGF